LQRLDALDTLNLLCLPGETDPDVLRAALEYAERRGAFLLIDPPGPDVEGTIALAESLARSDIANGAVYFPPVEMADPAGAAKTCPPSGAIAGMYARHDRAFGVWKAAAGAEAILAGITGLAVDLSDDEISRLKAAGVNAIRRLPTAGIRVWGSRTLQGGEQSSSEWKYIPVRRLALYVEESIDRGTRWAVFGPNDESLWTKLRVQIAVFLDGLFRAGALQGRTADEAYFVRCGMDTMTQNDLDNGRLTVVIGIAPVKPAEFVIVTIGQWISQSRTDSLEATGTPSERLRLQHRPVAAEGVFLQVAEDGPWATWTEVPDFNRAGPDDRVYKLDRESGELIFGDGRHGGLLPSDGQSIRATYRHGSGRGRHGESAKNCGYDEGARAGSP